MLMPILSGLKEVSPRCAKSVIPISAVLSVTVFCWVTATVVESLAASQILVSAAWAQSKSAEGQGSVMPQEELEEEEEIEETIVDRIHGALSGYVSATAGKVDSFFDDERYADEVNTSRVKLRVDYFLEKGEDPELKLRFNLTLALTPRVHCQREKTASCYLSNKMVKSSAKEWW